MFPAVIRCFSPQMKCFCFVFLLHCGVVCNCKYCLNHCKMARRILSNTDRDFAHLCNKLLIIVILWKSWPNSFSLGHSKHSIWTIHVIFLLLCYFDSLCVVGFSSCSCLPFSCCPYYDHHLLLQVPVLISTSRSSLWLVRSVSTSWKNAEIPPSLPKTKKALPWSSCNEETALWKQERGLKFSLYWSLCCAAEVTFNLCQTGLSSICWCIGKRVNRSLEAS